MSEPIALPFFLFLLSLLPFHTHLTLHPTQTKKSFACIFFFFCLFCVTVARVERVFPLTKEREIDPCPLYGVTPTLMSMSTSEQCKQTTKNHLLADCTRDTPKTSLLLVTMKKGNVYASQLTTVRQSPTDTGYHLQTQASLRLNLGFGLFLFPMKADCHFSGV